MTARAAFVGLMAALTLGSCSSGGWRDLDSIDALREVFASDQGHARIVLLLSPT
jgi:hypothetical protein